MKGEKMGMNIYTFRENKHIGKRYANGIWCWDCKVKAERDFIGLFWFCPQCHQRCSEKTLSYNPAYRELGFEKKVFPNHIGVDGASGFIWQIGETGIGKTKQEILKNIKRKKLITENNEKLNFKQFLDILNDVIEDKFNTYEFC